MTVYVDNAFIPASVPNGDRTVTSRWCHLTADTKDELHTFAAGVGLRRAWFQDEPRGKWHYDVTEGRRAAAVAAGAVQVTWRDMVEVMRRPGREGAPVVRAVDRPRPDPRPAPPAAVHVAVHQPDAPCGHWDGPAGRYCGVTPTNYYLPGDRCDDHTPAQMRQLAEETPTP